MAKKTRETQPRAKGPAIRMAANPLPPEEVFADGIAGILVRPGLVKLECYRVLRIDREDNAEVRCVTHRLVLPSAAASDLRRMLNDLAKGGNAG